MFFKLARLVHCLWIRGVSILIKVKTDWRDASISAALSATFLVDNRAEFKGRSFGFQSPKCCNFLAL